MRVNNFFGEVIDVQDQGALEQAKKEEKEYIDQLNMINDLPELLLGSSQQ